MDLIIEYGIKNGRLFKFFMDFNVKFVVVKGDLNVNFESYRRIIGKLIYLIVIRLDIVFII